MIYNVHWHLCFCCLVPTGTVSNLLISNATESSLYVSWNNVPCQSRGGNLIEYRVIVRDVTAGTDVFETSTRERNIKLSDLDPYNVYGVKVAYINEVGEGPMSDEVEARTLQDGKIQYIYYMAILLALSGAINLIN